MNIYNNRPKENNNDRIASNKEAQPHSHADTVVQSIFSQSQCPTLENVDLFCKNRKIKPQKNPETSKQFLNEQFLTNHIASAVFSPGGVMHPSSLGTLNSLLNTSKNTNQFYGQFLADKINNKKISLKKVGFRSAEHAIVFAKKFKLTHIDLAGIEGLTAENIEDLIEQNNEIKFLKIVGDKTNLKNLTLNSAKLSKLQTLILSYLPEFNQDLRDLPSLQTLTLYHLPLFDRDFSNLPLLQTLELIALPLFNRDLSHLPFLKTLILEHLPLFDQNLNGLSSLQTLELIALPLFNQDLSDLLFLKKLMLNTLESFNRKISDLPSLQELTLHTLPEFNQDLKDLSSLKSLILFYLPLFNQNLNGLFSLQILILEHLLLFNQNLNLKTLLFLKILELNNLPLLNQQDLKVIERLAQNKNIEYFIR